MDVASGGRVADVSGLSGEVATVGEVLADWGIGGFVGEGSGDHGAVAIGDKEAIELGRLGRSASRSDPFEAVIEDRFEFASGWQVDQGRAAIGWRGLLGSKGLEQIGSCGIDRFGEAIFEGASAGFFLDQSEQGGDFRFEGTGGGLRGKEIALQGTFSEFVGEVGFGYGHGPPKGKAHDGSK